MKYCGTAVVSGTGSLLVLSGKRGHQRHVGGSRCRIRRRLRCLPPGPVGRPGRQEERHDPAHRMPPRSNDGGSPPRARSSAMLQRARARLGIFKRSLGCARPRQRVVAALPPCSAASGSARRNTKAGTPDCSAASWSQREAVSGRVPSSPTTPASPAWRRHSSIAISTLVSLPASTKMIRSLARPARPSAGANRSRQRRHHSTGPAVRARMPAMKMVAAASSASAGLPATSCSAPAAMPPPGSTRRSPRSRTGGVHGDGPRLRSARYARAGNRGQRNMASSRLGKRMIVPYLFYR